MPVNIFGPHGPGINETTERPPQTASGSSVDTWFAPCVNGDPNSGTKVPARWLNFIVANLRRAVRGMGVPEQEVVVRSQVSKVDEDGTVHLDCTAWQADAAIIRRGEAEVRPAEDAPGAN